MALPKPCKRCGKTFQPSSKYSKLCNDCNAKAHKERNRRIKKATITL